jgi:predicted KAP-like P-loop ATPase
MTENKHVEEFSLSSDKPVNSPESDALGYASFSKNIADSIAQGVFDEGIVISIYGEWGAGKSTVLKFIEHYLKNSSNDIDIIHFNPWWYSGEEALLKSFFSQLQSLFSSWKSKGKELAKKIGVISEVLAKAPIAEAKAVDALLKKLLGTSLNSLKNEIECLLKSEKRKIVVVIDDIDRLTGDEVKQLFKLIKAVANFPYVAYLLAFDRTVVAKSLEDSLRVNGEDYIEKIIQVPFDLPHPEGELLGDLFFQKLNMIFASVPQDQHDSTYFGNLYHDGIKYFLNTPRDMVRLTNTLSITFPSVLGEVNHIDFLAIETIRVFEPKVYSGLRMNSDLFCGVSSSSSYGRDNTEENQRKVEAILSESKNVSPEIMKGLLTRLFPKLESVFGNMHYGHDSLASWRKEKRVCCEEMFGTYFRFSLKPGDISSLEVEGVVSNLNNKELLVAKLREFSEVTMLNGKSKLSIFLARLWDYLDDPEEDEIKILVETIFDIGDELLLPSDEQQAMFDDWGNDVRLGRILFRILPKLDPEDRYVLMKESFENGNATHFMCRETIVFGQQHGKYSSDRSRPDIDCIVTLEQQENLEKICLNKIRENSKKAEFVAKGGILGTLYDWKRWGDPDEPAKWLQEFIESDDLNIIYMLKMFESKSFSHGWGDRVAKSHSKVNVKNIKDFMDLYALKKRVGDISHKYEKGSIESDLIESFYEQIELFEKNPATYDEA